MGFNDFYRISAHAVITDKENRVLLLKATYNDKTWGLPGGAIEPGETVHDAIRRECIEELGSAIEIQYMSGIYYHSYYNSHVCIFRCKFANSANITLSKEHSEFRYFTLEELSEIQKQRVTDCLQYDGYVKSAKF
jgi:8-oxo-dGTP pyrophosphatase MutT (NUDIX family)